MEATASRVFEMLNFGNENKGSCGDAIALARCVPTLIFACRQMHQRTQLELTLISIINLPVNQSHSFHYEYLTLVDCFVIGARA